MAKTKNLASAELRVVPHDEIGVPRSGTGDLNLRVLKPLFRYVRTHHGEGALRRLIIKAGLEPTVLRRSAPWISHRAFAAVLAGARDLVGSDGAFMRACVFDIRRVYGPMVLVFRSMSVATTYRALARTGHLISRVSHYEVVEHNRDSVLLRYHSRVPDSHLSCLSRQAQLGSIPSLWWGIPGATVQVNARLCDGDDYCEYLVRWQSPLRLRHPAMGAALGAAVAYCALSLGPDGITPVPLAMAPLAVGTLSALLGGSLGLLLKLRHVFEDYVAMAEDTAYEVEQVVQAHARAMDEVLALHQREREWSHSIETRYHERREQLEKVVKAIEGRQVPSGDKLLSLSKDASSPVTALTEAHAHLDDSPHLEGEDRESVTAIGNAAKRLQMLLNQMSSIVRGDSQRVLQADEINIDELTNGIRRQLRATVTSSEVRVTVFQTREAPPRVRTDATLLGRVIDNLLISACTSTLRGSIVVEVAGTPGQLLLKISDTGRGISQEKLEQVFISGTPDPNPLEGTKDGEGLSIVARLLDQLGGRLEVMSTPGEGTTLWVSIPTQRPTTRDQACDAARSPRERFERVVKIRPRA